MTMCCLGGVPFVTSFAFRSCSTTQRYSNVTNRLSQALLSGPAAQPIYVAMWLTVCHKLCFQILQHNPDVWQCDYERSNMVCWSQQGAACWALSAWLDSVDMHIAKTGCYSGLCVPDPRGRHMFDECMNMHIEQLCLYRCDGALSKQAWWHSWHPSSVHCFEKGVRIWGCGV